VPSGTVLYAPRGFSLLFGTIVTFQVDRKANALLVQTHRPNPRAPPTTRPQPGTAPSAQDAVDRRVPSHVQRVQLPADMRWEDLRPTLTLWYAFASVCVVDSLRPLFLSRAV
jgi:hypothetical protein